MALILINGGHEALAACVVHVMPLIQQDAHAHLGGNENVTANVIEKNITA